MPDVTITGLPDATTPLSGTERVPMDQSGVTRDATAQDIADLAPYPPVVDGMNDGLMTSLQAIKLNEIEPLADQTTQARVLTALNGATIDNAILSDSLVTATALTDGATPSIDAAVAPLRTWTLGANGRTPSITWGSATAARSITLLINGNGFDTIDWSTIAPTWVGTAPVISSTGVTAVTFMRVDGVTYGFGPQAGVNTDWNASSGDAAILNKPTLGSLAALSALGNITSAGAIGSTANLPLITTTAGVVTAGSFGTAANTFCQGDDSRLSDARTPTAHNQAWSTITSTPTTRSGYGITDAAGNGAITGSGLTMATARLVGRTTAGTGAPEEISIGAGLALSAGELSATGGGGTDQPLFFDAAEFIPRTTNGCGISSEETATNRINRDLLAFDPGAIEYAQKGFIWPQGWATATCTFFWKGSSGTGSCVWAARMRVFTDGDAEDQAMGTAQSVTDAAASANTHRQTSATAAITPGGTVTSGKHCVLEVYRDATNGSDDLSVDALLIGVALTKAS